MSIFVSSKLVNSKFNVKKSVGPDVFNIVDNSRAVSIVGKKLDGDVITLTGNAADYAIRASGDSVLIRFQNDAGKFVTIKFSVKNEGSVTLAFADGGFSIDNLPGKGKIAIDGGLVSKRYLSVENYLDIDGLGPDGGALLNPDLATSVVNKINVNPVFTSGNTITINEDGAFSGQLTASDADLDSLEFALVGSADTGNGSVILGENGSYTYTPDADFNGTDSFVVSVSDGKGGVVLQTITVTVNPVNDAPSVSPDQFSAYADESPIAEDGRVFANTVAANDRDVDGDALTYALAPTQAPVAGLTFNSNGSFLFDPSNAAYQGLKAGEPLPVIVNYVVTDGKLTTPGTLTITVVGTNDLPVITSASTATVLEDNVLTGAVIATDVDKDTLEFALKDASAPSNGVVTVDASGFYTYTPNAGFSGTDSFVVTVSDGADTVEQTITVTVTEGDRVLSLTDGVDVLTGTGVRNVFQETASGQFSQDDIIAGGQFDATAEDTVEDVSVPRNDDDTLLLRSDTVTDVQFTNTSGIERLVMNSANGTGNDSVTLGAQAVEAGIVRVETRGGDDRIDVSAMTTEVAVDAGAGSDTLVLSGELGDVTLDLDENAIDIDNITLNGFENVDASALESGALTVIARAAGSTILGSDQADTITGGAGADVIRGGLGADTINTGAGANIVVFVGTLDAADNALYADYDGTVVVGDQTLNLGSVVTRSELTQLKTESDVAIGESLLSNPDDTIVIFGTADLSGLSSIPFPNTFVVNSSLTLNFNQIGNDTRVLGGLIGGEQTPSELIITGIPSNVVLELDALSLEGVEKLVLDIPSGADLPVVFPDSFVGEVYVFDQEGNEVLVSPARELVPKLNEDEEQVLDENGDPVLVFEPRVINDEDNFIREADIFTTDAREVVVGQGVVTVTGESGAPSSSLPVFVNQTPDILVLEENTTTETVFFEDEEFTFTTINDQQIDLTHVGRPIVVRGNEAVQEVTVSFADGNDNIVLDLAGGMDDVIVADQFAEDGQYSVRFVSSQVGDGSDQDVTVRDLESFNSFTVNDEGTVLSVGDSEPNTTQLPQFVSNPFNVQGINTDGSVAAGQNRGDFRYVVLGTSGSDDFEADDFGNLQNGGNVYINAGGGDDELSADAVAGQRHFLVGGTGNDKIVVSADQSSQIVVLAGSGDDVVELKQLFDDSQDGTLYLPYEGDFTLNGGAGRDALQISTSLNAMQAAQISGFEVLAFDVDYEGADDLTLDLGIFGANNTIDTIRVDEVESGAVILNNVGDAVTTLELVNSGDIEDSLTINRLNDTDSNSITIRTSPAREEEGFSYEIEGDLYLDDEEFIIIDTGSKALTGYVFEDGTEEFNTSDLDIEGLYAGDLQTLTIVGDGDVDLDNLNLGETARVVKIDASGSTGDVDVDVSESGEGISIDYIGSSGENDVEGTDGNDTITVVSNANDNDIEGNDGDDVISFTGNGLWNEIDGQDGDDTITVTAMLNDDFEPHHDGEYQVDIDGGADDDTITVTGTASVGINAGSGDDTVVSGAGDDRIEGGTGADSLTGGDGNDTFVYLAGHSDAVTGAFDSIADFDVDEDKLSFLQEDEHFHFNNVIIQTTANVDKFGTEAELLAGLASLDSSDAGIGNDAILFVIGDDGYLFVDTNQNDFYDVSSTTGDNDVLIKLVGVTDINEISFVGIKPSLPDLGNAFPIS